MSSLTSLIRRISLFVFLYGGLSLSMAQPALAIVGSQGRESARMGEVATSAVSKAEASVQIRRLKNLLVSRKAKNSNATFDALEKLQKNLRGQN